MPHQRRPALLHLGITRRLLHRLRRHPRLAARRDVPHDEVPGEASLEPGAARRLHALLQPQHRRHHLHQRRQSGSAGCHSHCNCCSGAYPLHLLGCEEGLRLHLHVPLPVHLPQRAAGVPHHPALVPAGKGRHHHLQFPGYHPVLGLHHLRHLHAAQAPHLQRVCGRRHHPLPGRHQPIHGPDVALRPVSHPRSHPNHPLTTHRPPGTWWIT